MQELMLILKINQLGLMMNSIEQNTVFIDYSGHVNSLSVRVYTKGWKKQEFPDYSRDVRLGQKNTGKKLRTIIRDLKGIGMEEDEEYVPKDEREFNVFELIDEEKWLDKGWEKENG